MATEVDPIVIDFRSSILMSVQEFGDEFALSIFMRLLLVLNWRNSKLPQILSLVFVYQAHSLYDLGKIYLDIGLMRWTLRFVLRFLDKRTLSILINLILSVDFGQ